MEDVDTKKKYIYRVSQKKVRFSLEAYISASRVSNDKTKTTIGKVF